MAKQTEGTRGWYAVHTYSGYENAVLRNLKQRIDSLNMQDKIFNVVIMIMSKNHNIYVFEIDKNTNKREIIIKDSLTEIQ